MRAALAFVKLTDDNMDELGAQVKAFDSQWEGEFRASALAIEANERILIISVDALIVPGDTAKSAVRRISAATGITEDNIMICGTHTHGGPCCIDFFSFEPNLEFIRRIEEGSVKAAIEAVSKLDSEDSQVQLFYGKSQESTVGRNSRLLLKDGSIGWYGYEEDDVVRPTGPYDPDLYVLAAKRADGDLFPLLFNHSVHNIGKLDESKMSPCFYGLTALEMGKLYGQAPLFIPGAFGSTHNVTYNGSGVPTEECIYRVSEAIKDALAHAKPLFNDSISVMVRDFNYQLRQFDEDKEADAVKYYMEKYAPEESEYFIKAFADMRQEMSPLQLSTGSTQIRIIRIGDIAFVGIPGELYARLGIELRNRSPFRDTCIAGLANEEIGYIPDRQAYKDGGYQTWLGWHSRLEPGTGEAMVNGALDMLQEMYDQWSCY